MRCEYTRQLLLPASADHRTLIARIPSGQCFGTRNTMSCYKPIASCAVLGPNTLVVLGLMRPTRKSFPNEVKLPQSIARTSALVLIALEERYAGSTMCRIVATLGWGVLATVFRGGAEVVLRDASAITPIKEGAPDTRVKACPKMGTPKLLGSSEVATFISNAVPIKALRVTKGNAPDAA